MDLKSFAKSAISFPIYEIKGANIKYKTCWAINYIDGRRNAPITPERGSRDCAQELHGQAKNIDESACEKR